MISNSKWEGKTCSKLCASTNTEFKNGDIIHCVLIEKDDDEQDSHMIIRQDYSVNAWKDVKTEISPFSYWKTKYSSISLQDRNQKAKASCELCLKLGELLSKIQTSNLNNQSDKNEEDSYKSIKSLESICYIIAITVERRRVFKLVKTEKKNGEKILLYENRQTMEVFLIKEISLNANSAESIFSNLEKLKEVYDIKL